MSVMTNNRVQGSIFLSAFGDAWGAEQEFEKNNSVLQKKFDDPQDGAFPDVAKVTDDTQMSLYVAKTIIRNKDFFDNYTVGDKESGRGARLLFADEFINWLHDVDNNPWRAPGNTCLSALDTYEEALSDSGEIGVSGFEGTRWDSKGCGANMRAPWIGLMTSWDLAKVAAVARDQAIVTHGHQYATLSASLTAMTVHGLLTGDIKPGHILDTICEKNYMDILPEKDAVAAMHQYLNEVDGEKDPYIILNPDFDMCALYGSGWVAEEAFVLAALITDEFMSRGVNAKNAINAVKRAAFITGDSDSVAFIVGAFVGAIVGSDQLPMHWAENLEPRYRTELEAAVASFSQEG